MPPLKTKHLKTQILALIDRLVCQPPVTDIANFVYQYSRVKKAR
ncbi:hypothetical protein SAMN04515695_0691 [Pseudovibrio sp. Tun.PSC04-5.I4]|nr:hypothetical protein SAMN04515695_0691 [Pseudovibrio sp. Tun.PSC04-5.I4]